jgi:hypothetical protein
VVSEGGVVEDPYERLGTKWGGQILTGSCSSRVWIEFLEVNLLQILQIRNG